jgi:hypothetical protein
MRVITEVARDEVQQTRLLTDVTIRRHAVVLFYAGSAKESP